jgi:uncharacterized coiled-coil protein SlyX
MNGLTAANVETILEKLDDCVDTLEQTHAHNLAANLADLVDKIQQMQRDNTTHTSRPDRVGDECWFRKGGDWQRGILRAWDVGSKYSMAIVEDKKTGVAKSTINISFSSEAPK